MSMQKYLAFHVLFCFLPKTKVLDFKETYLMVPIGNKLLFPFNPFVIKKTRTGDSYIVLFVFEGIKGGFFCNLSNIDLFVCE